MFAADVGAGIVVFAAVDALGAMLPLKIIFIWNGTGEFGTVLCHHYHYQLPENVSFGVTCFLFEKFHPGAQI